MPLDEKYCAHYESLSDYECLEKYLSRLPAPRSNAETHFLSHVLFDHYSDFVARFPWFDDLVSWHYEFREVTAAWIQENVRCEYGLSQWDHLYDKFPPDPLACLMREARTWPEEPVLFQIDDPALIQREIKLPLSSYHIVEGTHRIEYLRRMKADGIISPQSRHRLLVLSKKS
jgi:hypothetical protein